MPGLYRLFARFGAGPGCPTASHVSICAELPSKMSNLSYLSRLTIHVRLCLPLRRVTGALCCADWVSSVPFCDCSRDVIFLAFRLGDSRTRWHQKCFCGVGGGGWGGWNSRGAFSARKVAVVVKTRLSVKCCCARGRLPTTAIIDDEHWRDSECGMGSSAGGRAFLLLGTAPLLVEGLG